MKRIKYHKEFRGKTYVVTAKIPDGFFFSQSRADLIFLSRLKQDGMRFYELGKLGNCCGNPLKKDWFEIKDVVVESIECLYDDNRYFEV